MTTYCVEGKNEAENYDVERKKDRNDRTQKWKWKFWENDFIEK